MHWFETELLTREENQHNGHDPAEPVGGAFLQRVRPSSRRSKKASKPPTGRCCRAIRSVVRKDAAPDLGAADAGVLAGKGLTEDFWRRDGVAGGALGECPGIRAFNRFEAQPGLSWQGWKPERLQR